MNKQETTAACRHIHLSTTQLRLQPSLGETAWGDYWLPFGLTQSGHKLANLPAIVCTETALSCPVEPTVSRYDRSDSNVTHHSPPLLVVCASSSSTFSSVFLVLLFQSCAISLSIRVCIPFFLARTLIFSSTLCPAKHLTFVWQCFSLDVYTCRLCVLCISVGVLSLHLSSCMSLSCVDGSLYASRLQRSGETPAQRLTLKKSREVLSWLSELLLISFLILWALVQTTELN